MCCTRLAENTGRKNYAKKSPSAHHRTNLLGYVFATKAYTDNRKKNSLNSNISPTCRHHRSRIRYLSKKIANFNEFSEIKKIRKNS